MVLGCLPSMYLTSMLARTQGQEETALKVKCFKEAFNWFKKNLVSWCKNQGEVPGGGSPPAFGSVSVEVIQETSEIFILTNIDGQILQTISNGWPVTINGTGLQLPVLKQVPKEVSNWLYRWCPKSTWWMIHHLVKMTHLPHRLIWLTPLWGASILAATASDKSCSSIAEALGTLHGD